MDTTTKLIAIVLLAAFAIERILAAANYLMDPERLQSREKDRRKLLLLALGGAVALAVVDFAGIRVLRLLNPLHAARYVDYWLTWLIVFAGAERVRDLLQGVKGVPLPERRETPAVRIQVDGAANVHELRTAS